MDEGTCDNEVCRSFTLMTKAILGFMAKSNGGVLIVRMDQVTPFYGREDQVSFGYTSEGDLIFSWEEELR